MMLRVGLSGGIGCGKSEVSNIFTSLGVPVLDADEIALKLTDKDSPYLNPIVEIFGKQALNNNGTLNRKYIRSIIFDDATKRENLNQILHPAIRKHINHMLDSLTTPYCIITIPLLIEADMLDVVDYIIIVDCPRDIQIERIIARDQCTKNEAEKIIKTQASREKKLAIADIVIQNDKDLDYLKQLVQSIHKRLLNHYEK